MAIPAVHILADCANYSQTVAPYVDQLWALPERLWQADSSAALLDIYQTTNPLVSGFAMSLALGAVFLIVSEINDNYSQVDRFWGLLPTFYMGHFNLWARLAGLPSRRLDAVLFVGLVWSTRLTYNYARKGGYSIGSEDYRWMIVRKSMPPWAFHVLNWTFISFVQSVLLFALAAPAYVIMLASQLEPESAVADAVFVAMELGLVAIGWLSDEQQWRYQAAKRQFLQMGNVAPGFRAEALRRGFVAEGLWAYSRHPNFAAEQAVWLVLYQWSSYASSTLVSWAGAGAAALILLFQSSTRLTEDITAGKYAEYAAYQQQICTFVPTSLRPYEYGRGREHAHVPKTQGAEQKGRKDD